MLDLETFPGVGNVDSAVIGLNNGGVAEFHAGFIF
jgi:hypothetical protein